MFEPHYYYDFFRISDKDVDKQEGKLLRRNLFAIHFKRWKGYHKSWKMPKILMFEYLLLCDRIYRHSDKNKRKGKQFSRKRSTIADATRLSPRTVTTYYNELEAEGYITIERNVKGSTNQLNWYTINYKHIKDSLEKIYNFEGLSDETIKAYKEFLCECYDYHSKSPYEEREIQEEGSSEDAEGYEDLDPFGGKAWKDDRDAFDI